MLDLTPEELYTLRMILKEHIYETTDLVEEAIDFDKPALTKELNIFKSIYEKVLEAESKRK